MRNNLPSVTSDIPRDLRYFIDRVSEVIKTLQDANLVSVQDLVGAGIGTDGGNGTIGPPPTGSGPDGQIIIPVLTPPAPSGFTVLGGYEFITLSWDAPTYYGHAYARIYRNTTGVFDSSTDFLTITEANVFSDFVGNANSTYDPETGEVTGQTTFYYWVSFVNINTVEGPTAGPESDTTAIDVEEVLQALSGSLASTALIEELSTLVETVGDNYVVKLAAGGVAAGFGLANTGPAEAPTFDFAILANNFFITPPIAFNQAEIPTSTAVGQVWRKNDASPVEYYIAKIVGADEVVSGEWEQIDATPFIVRTTDGNITNADGEEVFVPAGVYITDAYIQDGTITRAKIGTAAIDNAKIAQAAITAANVAYLDANRIVTGSIRSPNFTNAPGAAGFLLSMTTTGVFIPTLDVDGNFQFNQDGTIVGEFEDEFGNPFNQEDIVFILRGAFDGPPALQLIDGDVTISALYIRDVLQSVGYAAGNAGFKFDISGDDPNANIVEFRADGDSVNDPSFVLDNNGLISINAAAIKKILKSSGYDAGAGSPGFKFDITGEDPTGNIVEFRSSSDAVDDPSFFMDSTGNINIKGAIVSDLQVDAADIADGTITTAKIAEAAIGTLQIAGNAVTIPEGAYGTATISGSPGVDTVLLTKTIDYPTPAGVADPLDVKPTALLVNAFALIGTGGFPSNQAGTATLKIKVGSTTIAQVSISPAPASDTCVPLTAIIPAADLGTNSTTVTLAATLGTFNEALAYSITIMASKR